MKEITFITGNQSKADYLAKYLGHPIDHLKVELDEIQSLDLKKIIEHKARQAYGIVKRPVLVDDISLEFKAWGKLPGPFIKYFVEQVPFETICRSLDGLDRSAVGRCVFGYFDGKHLEIIEGELHGKIADEPAGENGFGWDRLFIPNGYDITRAQLDHDNYEKVYRIIRPIDRLKSFLDSEY